MERLERKKENLLVKLRDSFINYLDVDNDTLKSYENGINNFLEYLDENNISNPTRNDVIDYRNHLRETYASNTVNSYMSSIRNMFKYLELNGFYKDITFNVKGAKISSTPRTQVLSLEQSQDIYKTLKDLREKVIFGLLITTGMRGVELANLKLEDIKLHNNEPVAWILCKGHSEKDEYVKLSDTVLEDIKEYIGTRTSGYLIVGEGNKNNGGGVTTKTLRYIIKNIFKRNGLDIDRFSLHTMRRSFATIGYELGADIKELQQILHHRANQTTLRYINASTRDNNKTEYNLSNAILGG